MKDIYKINYEKKKYINEKKNKKGKYRLIPKRKRALNARNAKSELNDIRNQYAACEIDISNLQKKKDELIEEIDILENKKNTRKSKQDVEEIYIKKELLINLENSSSLLIDKKRNIELEYNNKLIFPSFTVIKNLLFINLVL